MEQHPAQPAPTYGLKFTLGYSSIKMVASQAAGQEPCRSHPHAHTTNTSCSLWGELEVDASCVLCSDSSPAGQPEQQGGPTEKLTSRRQLNPRMADPHSPRDRQFQHAEAKLLLQLAFLCHIIMTQPLSDSSQVHRLNGSSPTNIDGPASSLPLYFYVGLAHKTHFSTNSRTGS